MKSFLCPLLIFLFLCSCGDDDTTITPVCTTGDFSIQIDTTVWEAVGHLSELTLKLTSFNDDVEKKTLGIAINGPADEQLLISIIGLRLINSGSDPHADGIEPKEYFADP